MRAFDQKRRHPALDLAQKDQIVAVGIAGVKESQIAPTPKIAQIPRRLIADQLPPGLIQSAWQMGEFLVCREILDGQVQRQQRDQIADGRVVQQPVGEILIGKANKADRLIGSFDEKPVCRLERTGFAGFSVRSSFSRRVGYGR